MTRMLFDLSALGLVLGLALHAHECMVAAVGLFAIASVLWLAAYLVADYRRNASASIDLMRSERQRDGRGAI